MRSYYRLLLIIAITASAATILFISSTGAQNGRALSTRKPTPKRAALRKNGPLTTEEKLAISARAARAQEKDGNEDFNPVSSTAVAFIETRAVRDLKPEVMSRTKKRRLFETREDREKNEANTRRVKPESDPTLTGPFTDPTLKASDSQSRNSLLPAVITNPIANFDGPDMDAGAILFGGRFAPPDTNAAVGPNHVVAITNGGFQVYNKTGTPLTPLTKLSALLVGIPNAADDDGDPIVLYDSLADRWILSQFNLRVTNNSTHEHIAVSKTGDPTGAYYAYDFLMVANRPADYPHMGVWPDGYYMSTNDFSLPVFSNPFQGAGLYAFERAKMLVGDPTAKVIAFSTNNQHGGMLPTNFQGYTPPPAGTPNLFMEFDADEFGAATDLVRAFAFHVDFNTPANSTLTQGPDIPTLPFDARSPSTRAAVAQPAPGEGLDAIADRLMHALNFRVLPGGVQSYVLNFTVNVSGVNPTSAATYQTGVRWMELRRNAGNGALSINQQATYAPGSGNPTGRDVWMAAVAQDGEGNIGLGANATNSTATPTILNPTAIYTGRLAGDPLNTLPQGEVDAMSAVTKGVQTSTSNRWGDYSSLFIDPADDCTFWGAFEYVDSPTASFDWNTRVFSFKVNPTCVTPQKGNLQVNVTNCETGLPIESASITVDGNQYGATLANGQFNGVLPPGNYAVAITKPNFSVVNQNVSITNGNTTVVNVCLAGVPTLGAAGSTLVNESCPPTNGAVDPGETATVNLAVTNSGGASTTNLVGTLSASANVLAPSGPQNYGAIAPGGTVARNYTFTANGNCGDLITLSLQLQDGANNLGTVLYTVRLGAQQTITALSENFDGVTAPALPAGWTTSASGVEVPWVTTTTNPSSAPNAAFAPDVNNVGNSELVTPSLAIPAGGAQLTFKNLYNMESTFDGMVLEISINGGAFADIITAGGSFVSGGYNATISSNFASPIAGRRAWSGLSGGTTTAPLYIDTAVNLPATANGQNIQLKWRAATDNSVAASGQNGVKVDNVLINATTFVCNLACAGAPRLTTAIALTCSGPNVLATLTVSNTGTATANGVTLTTAKIVGSNGTPIPQSLGNIPPGGSVTTNVTFSGAPSGAQTVQVGGTYTGGSFSTSRKMSVPNCAPAAPGSASLTFPTLSTSLAELAYFKF